MLPGGGVASDVDGLFLGRQQSVHGSRHSLHVNLRAETHFSGGTEAAGAVWALPQGWRERRHLLPWDAFEGTPLVPPPFLTGA